MSGGTAAARRSDPALPLLHALATGAPCGCALELVDMASTAWASATFTGARHVIRLQGDDDPALTSWLAGLSDAQFRLRGQIVADVKVASVERRDGAATIVIEALTLEDG